MRKIVSSMNKLGVTSIVNNGVYASEISKKSKFSLTKTKKLLGMLGTLGITDYIRNYNYWIFQHKHEKNLYKIK